MKDWTEIEYDDSDLEVEMLNLMTEDEFENYLKKIYEAKKN